MSFSLPPFRLLASRPVEILSYGLATVGAFAPIYLMVVPSAAGDYMARQTTRWAPRWEHVTTNYLTPRTQNAMQKHVRPPIERTMKHVERLAYPHFSRAALNVDRRIRQRLNQPLKE